MKLTLGVFFIHLIQKKGFYGRLASSVERVPRPGMGTLAVGIREGRAVLFYVPEFVLALPLKSALFAIEHEMLHLVLDHIPRYLELLALCPTDLDRVKAAKVYNIAMDCAINTMLRGHEGFDEIEQFSLARIKAAHPDAPDDPRNGMCLPEKWDLPLDGSFEFYQWSLMQKVKVIDLSSVLGGTDHSLWTGEDSNGESESDDGSGRGKSKGKQPGGRAWR